jgi:GxxExxY protein
MEENDISYIIRGAIFEVYNTLGPGLLESVYTATLTVELIDKGLSVKREVPVPVFYKERKLDVGLGLIYW